MNQTEGGQSCATEVKIEEEPYRDRERLIKYEHANKRNDRDEIFSRESQANWNMNGDNYDNKSMKSIRSTSTSKSKRAPNQEDLCQAILTLRKKLPQRSLEQIIIRLYQSVDYKKKADSISNGSRKNYEPSQCSRKDDFDDSKSFAGSFSFNENFFQNMKEIEESRAIEYSQSVKNMQDSNGLKHNESHMVKKMQNNFSSDGQSMQQYDVRLNRQEEITEAGINYIYRPKGDEVVVEYLEQKTKKVNFINIEEETRYIERRVMAKSFIERGYGVSQCRKEIQAQNLTIEMHRNTYKTLAGSVIILAFRKLQSFIANECGKTIKYLDRWQMRSICTTMLNCRTNMEPQTMATLFKYIKAGYGLGDVTIGQIESVKLYLAIQRNIHGKNITMQSLQRIGEINQKKSIDLTHQYLNRKKAKRQQRLQKLRKLRLQVKEQKRKDREKRAEQTFRILDQIDLNHPDIKYEELQAASKANSESNAENEEARQPALSQVSHSQLSVEEQAWRQQFDVQFANLYLKSKDTVYCITTMQEGHDELANWSIELFQKRFCKIIKKSVKKVQLQSQMSQEQELPVLNKLDKDQMRRIMYSPQAETVRIELLSYFVLQDPNLEMLIEVVALTNVFLYGQSQGWNPQRKRGRGRPPIYPKRESIKQMSSNGSYNSQGEYCLYKPLDQQINFEQQFTIGDQQLRNTFGDNDMDLDLDINELRFQQDQLNTSNNGTMIYEATQSVQLKESGKCEIKNVDMNMI